jgi:hypothetical protein
VLLVLPALAAAEESELAVRYEAGRLSVSARAAPLEDVLAEVATASGVRIEMESAPLPSGETVTLTVEGISLEDGLRRILGKQGFVLFYSPAGLAEVRVYRGPSAGAARDADPDIEVGESVPRELPPAAVGRRRARRNVAAAPENPAELARLRAEALSGPDPASRATAFITLSTSRDRALARETALTALRAEREETVLQSALTLLLRQGAVPVDAVLPLARRDRAAGVRLLALQLLVRDGARDPRVTGLLTELAGAEPDPAVRETARELLQGLER